MLIIAVAPAAPVQSTAASSSPSAAGVGRASLATGTIQGRVSNPATGEYLEKARVTIEGTNFELLTDNLGQYRFSGVPAGPASVKVFYTGFPVQTETVTVGPDQIVVQDFALIAPGRAPVAAEPGVQKLSEFVVSETREMDGAAIAINEQRFAPDIRNVIAANEFGPKGEGDIGELLQFLPGIAVDFGDGGQGRASINGVPADNVPVTVNGFDLASARGTTTRFVSLNAIPTTYNISRIEILHSPTPEMPGMALAGSINVVPLSAFDRSKPVFNTSVFVMMRDDVRDFEETAGPGRDPTRKAHPGFNFSYIVPVNERFGFSVSGGFSRQYLQRQGVARTWRGVGTVTNGNAFPDTVPGEPYLTQFTVNGTNMESSRRSFGASVDYKLGANDRLSFSFQYTKNVQKVYNPALIFTINRVLPGNFGPTFTRGAPGQGEIAISEGDRIVTDEGYTPTLTYRHNGPVWRAEAGLGRSHAIDLNQQYSKGMFFSTRARRTGVTVAFEDIDYLRPGAITVTDGTTGAPVDPYNLDSYVLATANYHVLDELPGDVNKVKNVQHRAYANLARDFTGRLPFTLKAGLDVRQNIRDLRIGGQKALNFVGADGLASTTVAGSDDRAGIVRYDDWQGRVAAGYGFPQVQWISNSKFFDLYTAQPSHFTSDEAATHRAITNQSKRGEEVVSAAFVRGDLSLVQRRLKVVGGVRAEQTNLDAEGPLTDPTRNFQRDASGRVLRGSNGQPLPLTTDPLEAARLTAIDRGMKVEREYLRWFPSINVGYTIRDNLIARAAYYHSLGRPDFNQYAGGLTLPDTEALNPGAQRIRVNNAAIKAWTARTVKLNLEYYFQRVGLISVGVFRRQFENFFGSVVFEPTPEFLELYNLDPATYGQYLVATQYNLQNQVRMEGVDVNYKQALTFLPHWARGVQVFANASALRTLGDETADFAGYVPRAYSWGFSLSREKFNLKLNWNYRGKNRRDVVAVGRGIEPDTWRWQSKQMFINFRGEYYVHKNFALYANLNTPAMNDIFIEGPSTPPHAQLTTRQQYGGMWTFGVSSSF